MNKKTLLILAYLIVTAVIIEWCIKTVYNKNKSSVVNIPVKETVPIKPSEGLYIYGGELDKDILIKLSKCKHLHYYFNINGSNDTDETRYRFYQNSKQCDLMIDYQKTTKG